MQTHAGRILVVNPNSSEAVTAAIDAALAPLRLPGGPGIAVVRLPEGPPSLGTQREVDDAAVAVARRVEREAGLGGADAFVVACFSDPGLHGAREAAGGRPVMGIGECGILRALTLGERFGIVALSGASVARQRRMVGRMGLGLRYAGSRPVEASAVDTAGEAIRGRLIAAARDLVRRDGADAVVLGCAGMAGHRAAVEAEAGCPVIEPCREAAAAALTAVLLRRADAA